MPISVRLPTALILVVAVACASAPSGKQDPEAKTSGGQPAPAETRATAPAPTDPLVRTTTVTAPIAKKDPTERVLFGERFVDDYFWLKKKGDAEVESYLRAEDAYARAVLAP